MKRIYITLSLLATMTMTAQNKDTETADKLFAKFEYMDAAKEYLKLSNKKDAYVYKQLAESYYNLFNSKEAIKWYEKLTALKEQDAETYYRYAQMLKVEGRYEEANAQMKKFAAKAPKDQRAVLFNQDPDYIPQLKSDTKLYDVKILDINDNKYADFSGILTDDKTFYFTSTRNTARRTYGRNEEPYQDIYTATFNDNGSFSEPTPLSEINSQWHDGPVAITSDGKTMYFASESFKEGKFEKDTPGQRTGLIYLFKATRESGGKWGNIQALPFNDKKWSTGNPTVSKDGKWLYFASNRDGSMGGSTDIWKAEIKAGNTYGKPENLGSKVNTEGRENFPFITDDNKLYFASEGRKGLGGMDIFVIDLANTGDAVNLGVPINSPKDDFGFSFNKTRNVGFYSSNKAGTDDLYLAVPICGVEAIVQVRDTKTKQPLANAKVSILDDRNNIIQTSTADAAGNVSYSVDCDRAYTIQASKDGYIQNTFPVDKAKGGTVNVTADLVPVETLIVGDVINLKEIYFEFDKSNITPEGAAELDKLVSILKSKPTMVVMAKAHTDNRGSAEYNLSLSDRRARAMMQYVLSKGIAEDRMSGKGYGESEPKFDCGENCSEEQHAANRRIEFLIVKK